MNYLILFAVGFCGTAAFLHFISIFTVARRLHRCDSPAFPPHRMGGVSILRPICGVENFIEQTLQSTFRLDHPQYEILFCVAHLRDPVIPLVQRLIERHPGVDARLLVGNNEVSANPKLNNLVKGWRAARHDWILMVDSNVLMPPDQITRMLSAWQPDTGLVCSPPVGAVPQTLWAEVECAFLNTFQARWQCFADSIGLGFAQGKAMLCRRELIERAGGIESLGSEVAEDAAATKHVRGLGLKVRLVADPFLQPLGCRNAADVWKRQVRWARLRRDTFKWYFVPEILAGAFAPFAAAAAVAAAFDWPVLGSLLPLAVAWYGAEAFLAYTAGWPLTPRSVAAWVLRDALMPLVWTAAWIGDDFEWRGNAMSVADRGRTA